jgi:hypothetical protein
VVCVSLSSVRSNDGYLNLWAAVMCSGATEIIDDCNIVLQSTTLLHALSGLNTNVKKLKSFSIMEYAQFPSAFFATSHPSLASLATRTSSEII